MSNVEALLDWSFEKKAKKAVEALKKNWFTAMYCKTKNEALDYILNEAKSANTIGFGGSMTIANMELAETLKNMGKKLLIHGSPSLSQEEKIGIMRQQLTCDLFLTSTNALTLDGQLVNVDGTGNRVSSMIFGPKKVIVVAGRNKLVPDVKAGLDRIKILAAPTNAKRLDRGTSCVSTGICTDCSSSERICRAITIIQRKPNLSDIHVLVVNEDMGF